jgi:hypothetical protein
MAGFSVVTLSPLQLWQGCCISETRLGRSVFRARRKTSSMQGLLPRVCEAWVFRHGFRKPLPGNAPGREGVAAWEGGAMD